MVIKQRSLPLPHCHLNNKVKATGTNPATKQAEQPIVDATNAPFKSEAVLSTPEAAPDSTAKAPTQHRPDWENGGSRQTQSVPLMMCG